MLFKGNSSRLQLLIEKIQSNNKDANDEHDIEGIHAVRKYNGVVLSGVLWVKGCTSRLDVPDLKKKKNHQTCIGIIIITRAYQNIFKYPNCKV